MELFVTFLSGAAFGIAVASLGLIVRLQKEVARLRTEVDELKKGQES